VANFIENVKNFFKNDVFGVPDFIDGGGDNDVSVLDAAGSVIDYATNPDELVSTIIGFVFLAVIYGLIILILLFSISKTFD
jgi:hypothetical protein